MSDLPERLRIEKTSVECAGGCDPAILDEAADEIERLQSFLHSLCMHPDYEYEITSGPRKAFDVYAPSGNGWERNTDNGRDGWERFDYHEEAYWRRKKETT